jgi:zinc/manganese transport system substrate-binding protein
MNFLKIIILVFSVIITNYSQVKVVTTTTVIYDLVKEIGGEKVSVDYICRGDQDPHFLEILPSYMLKIRKANVMFQTGLGLELWAQRLIDGSRNSSLKLIDLSKNIEKKGIPSGRIDASQGDIHPFGNPHYWLDPENVKLMAEEIFNALAAESPNDFEYFSSNYEKFNQKLESKSKEWEEKMKSLKGKSFLFFHDSWIYFTEYFNIIIAGYIEPKPGIPPTPSHNAELIKIAKNNNVTAIVMCNFYSDSAPNQISNISNAKVVKVPLYVYGIENADSYFKMMDFIINQFVKNG